MTRRTIGVIGLGLMGTGMWSNLLKAQYAVVGFDVNPVRVAALEAGGGTGAGDATSVAEAADVIISSLPSAPAFEATAAGRYDDPETMSGSMMVPLKDNAIIEAFAKE